MADPKQTEATSVRCANCGEAAGPRFCPHCGQEIQARQGPLLQVTREILSDWLSLDGKLWRSLRALVVPGRLSVLYLSGKRAPFVRPFRLYLLASVVLFSTALTLKAPDVTQFDIFLGGHRLGETAEVNEEEIQIGSKKAKVRNSIQLLDGESSVGGLMLQIAGDRIQRLQAIPPQEAAELIFAGMRKSLPPMLILFVPLLALGLKLLYIRRRGSHHLYIEHLVFSIHFQTTLFLAMSAAWLISRLARFEVMGSMIASALAIIVILFVYLPLALRRFYEQSRFITGLKMLGVLYLYSQLLGLIVGVSVLVGIWNI